MRVVGVALAVVLGAAVPGVFMGLQGEPIAAAVPLRLAEPDQRFEWSTSSSLSDVALEVTARVEGPSDCRLQVWAAGRSTGGGGPEYVKIVRTESGRAWSALTDDGLVQVHAEGALDSRSVLSSGERWALESSHRRPGLEGTFTWFFAARGLEAWPGHAWTGPDSLRFLLECDAPLRIDSMLTASGARMLNERALARGQTLYLGPAGTLAREDETRVDLGSASARLLLAQRGNEGTMRLTTPRGPSQYDLALAPGFLELPHGPGAYGVGLDCFCQGSLWAILADLRPAESLDELVATG